MNRIASILAALALIEARTNVVKAATRRKWASIKGRPAAVIIAAQIKMEEASERAKACGLNNRQIGDAIIEGLKLADFAKAATPT